MKKKKLSWVITFTYNKIIYIFKIADEKTYNIKLKKKKKVLKWV